LYAKDAETHLVAVNSCPTPFKGPVEKSAGLLHYAE
jgi:hypothetical protein